MVQMPAWLWFILVGLGVGFLGGCLLMIEDKDMADMRSLGWALAVIAAASIVCGVALFPRAGKKTARKTADQPREPSKRARGKDADVDDVNEVEDEGPSPVTDQAVAQCTDCGKRLRVRANLAGKRVKCPSCGARFLA